MFAKNNWQIFLRLFRQYRSEKLEKLVRGFLVKTITLKEHPTKGGRPELKSMYKSL
jgi:hypothetical protein